MAGRRKPGEGPDDRLVTLGLAIGGFGPFLAAALLLPFRDEIDSANAALVFVVIVVLAAAAGGRWAGAVAAVTSALSFDFFFTRPYLSLTIDSADDVETTLLLLAVGLIVGQLVVWAHRGYSASSRSRGEIDRLHRVAEEIARGAELAEVFELVQGDLVALLSLRRCRFEEPPFGTPLPRLERNGWIDMPRRRFIQGDFALPAEGVEIPVLGRGRQLGRFVLDTRPDVGVSIEARVVAIALSDQLGAILAAERREPGSPHPN